MDSEAFTPFTIFLYALATLTAMYGFNKYKTNQDPFYFIYASLIMVESGICITSGIIPEIRKPLAISFLFLLGIMFVISGVVLGSHLGVSLAEKQESQER